VSPAHVLVLGAGISGLTCAHELARRGLGVTVWARDEPLATTSAVAAALLYPFEAGPKERVAAWALRAHARFVTQARSGVPGVTLVPLHDLHSPALEAPTWLRGLPEFAPLAPGERQGFAEGWRVRVPGVETPLYLPWLAREVRARGVELVARTVRSLDETRGFDAVVNATGLGAAELVGDRECYPIRGQIARVPRGAVDRALVFQRADGSFGYIVPRARDCVLGGTAERGVDSLAVDASTSLAILARCRALEPRLVPEVESAAAGLRPGRAAIRLERERLPDGRPLVHDYGHGGCGVTLSWACAEDVVALVTEALG
jgi:D-amino-acid oxidase